MKIVCKVRPALAVVCAVFAPGMIGVLMAPVASAHGNHNQAPWQACESAERNAACSFEDGHGSLYKGTCQSFNDKLMCVRNQPVVKNKPNDDGDESRQHRANQ